MINNQSDQPEKLQPRDSERKDAEQPKENKEAVLKPGDKSYTGEEADFGNVAVKKKRSDREKS